MIPALATDAREALAARWDERIARARELAARHPAAADLLTFRARIAELQRDVARSEATGDEAALPFLPAMLSLAEREGPPLLAEAARSLRSARDSEWLDEFARCRSSGGCDANGDAARALVVEALAQPLAERAARGAPVNAPAGDGVAQCPACGGLPMVGVLRDAAQGARRSLVCGFCLTEWNWPRIVCPACRESTFTSLAAFATEEFPAVRLDACETCRAYIKTIDLTKDAMALPLVDEIASLPLDLWAREQGYRKVRLNLLGE